MKRFDPAAFGSFRFGTPTLSDEGLVRLPYTLGDELEFVEEFELPMPADREGGGLAPDSETVRRLLRLLHLTAGVSYYKMAVPRQEDLDG